MRCPIRAGNNKKPECGDIDDARLKLSLINLNTVISDKRVISDYRVQQHVQWRLLFSSKWLINSSPILSIKESKSIIIYYEGISKVFPLMVMIMHEIHLI